MNRERLDISVLIEAQKNIRETSIPGLYKVERESKTDHRGGFRMVALARELEVRLQRKFEFAQWNHSWSNPRVLRGIHPDTWDKLVYPVSGSIFMAIADVRPDSPTFKTVETFVFEEGRSEPFALFVSRGLGNGFCNFGEKTAHYVYMVNEYWDGTVGSGQRGVPWNDLDLAIPWPISDPILSDPDKSHRPLREQFPQKFA